MNRITFNESGDILGAAVVLVGLVLSAIALTLDMLIANAAPSFFGASGEVPAFGLGKVLMASVPAVLGNTYGFYMSYRSYDPRALVKFLAPAAGFSVAFMIPPVWGLIAGGNLAAFAVAALLNIVPVAVAVSVLLGLRPGPRTGSALALSPGNA
ncbi:MAG: hypothetical protein H0V28_08340 [Rubrobacteraceae bacterium]|jgi:hypothetical protein|nr:hypothetical protein [Rubrobacteraceae bacterium]MDQ3302328.1 hypothetical protein [Actinomycetota bacterium]